MPARRSHERPVQVSWIHSPRLHVVMYSMLLVATPFLLLRRFLQEAIGKISKATFPLAGLDVPVVPVAGVVVLVVLLLWVRTWITWRRVLAGLVAVLLIGLAQQISDYYFGHDFYELQQNWHYIAYALFAFMIYRDLAPRGVALSRIILITYCAAALFSSFDEAFQLRLSGRVFDMGDIAKDVWGTFTGLVVLYVGGDGAGRNPTSWRPLRHRRLRDYFAHPPSLLILLFVLSLLFVCFSSLLTDFPYWKVIILFTLCSSILVFLVIHLSQYRAGKYALLALLLIVAATQGYFFWKYRASYVVYQRPGLVVYKGIPVPFFDVMIFPNGAFRPVDRKAYFNARDRIFFRKRKADIILIGSGAHGEGGRGFPQAVPNQFIYNPFTERGTQVLILPTAEACPVFNRLKQEGKNVLFILHNTFS